MTRIVLALLALVAGALALRPAAPIDETRYLAVAWEMQLDDAWLVPRLDGEPYHHKPPLLFWLIRAGWLLTGPNEVLPRLIPALCALLILFLTGALARRLGKRSGFGPPAAVLLLAGCLALSVYATVLLFDLLLTVWVLVGVHALLDLAPPRDTERTRTARGILGVALAVGLGTLTKGPVILVYLLPALVAWTVPRRPRALLAGLVGVVGGAALALAWALPAAAAGGEAYAGALLGEQTAGRLRDSFSHARPFWWYAPIIVLLLLPWSLWPRFWRSLRLRADDGTVDGPGRLLLGVGGSLAIFLLISGKQPHYLVPLLPLVAVVAGARLPRLQVQPARHAAWLTPLVVLIGLTAASLRFGAAFDPRPAAEALRARVAAGHPPVWTGEGHGQLTFAARLREAPRVVHETRARDFARWLPQGVYALTEKGARRHGLWTDEVLAHAWHRQAWRGGELALVPGWALLGPQPDFEDARATARTAVERALADGSGPGISVAVGHRGRLVWAEGFGQARLLPPEAVTTATRFRVGSVSKPMTAVALMKLVEDGALALDDPVRRWVDAFPEKRWPVTLRQLAGHLGGIRHYRGAEFLSQLHYPTVTDGLAIFADDPLLHEPGTRYRYSSYGWNLLSAAMEQADGRDFLSLMHDEVFAPLGMHDTVPDFARADDPRRTSFHQTVAGLFLPAPPVDNSYKWAGGGFLATPSDLVRFGFGVLGPALLSSETRREMFRPQRTRDGQPTGYAIGWRSRRDPELGRVWSHSGGSVGGVTQLTIWAEPQLVVAVVINNSEGPAGRLARRVAAPFLQTVRQSSSASASR